MTRRSIALHHAAGLDNPTAWFLVQVGGGLERYVSDAFERKGFKPYMPMVTKIVRPQNRPQVVARPLFPSYVFVGLDLGFPAFTEVRKTHGVKWLVTSADKPVRVPDAVVLNLDEAERGGLFDETRHKSRIEASGIEVGTRVVVSTAAGDFAAEVMAMPSTRRIEVVLRQYGKRATVPLASLRVAT